MVDDELIKGVARRWLRWSDEDLVAARHTAADEDIPPRVACAHAQQSAEKAIKSLLIAKDIDPPRSHNLLRLARMLDEEKGRELLALKISELNRWAIEGRYPADADEATASDAACAVELSMQVNVLAHREMERGSGDIGQ